MKPASHAIEAEPSAVGADQARRSLRSLRPSLAAIGLVAALVGTASVVMSIMSRVALVGGSVPGGGATRWLLRRLPEARVLEGVGFLLLVLGAGALVVAALRCWREPTS